MGGLSHATDHAKAWHGRGCDACERWQASRQAPADIGAAMADVCSLLIAINSKCRALPPRRGSQPTQAGLSKRLAWLNRSVHGHTSARVAHIDCQWTGQAPYSLAEPTRPQFTAWLADGQRLAKRPSRPTAATR